jgi:hypothetical protein
MTLLDIPITLYSCVFVCVCAFAFRLLLSLSLCKSSNKNSTTGSDSFDFWLNDKWLKMHELRIHICVYHTGMEKERIGENKQDQSKLKKNAHVPTFVKAT